MNSDINELKSGGEEFLSVGDRLGYEKDSKERMPWEHYLDAYGKLIPWKSRPDFRFRMIRTRSALPFLFWDLYMRSHGLSFGSAIMRTGRSIIRWKR